jgi:hypothetical protein
MTSILLALVELSRVSSESQMKSERVGAAWANKKRRAAERIVTRKLPGWVCVEGDDVTQDREPRRPGRDGDRLVLIPGRAEIVRRVYRLALAGHGVHAIARVLNESAVPVLGRTEYKGRPVVWSETVVYHLLKTTKVRPPNRTCSPAATFTTRTGSSSTNVPVRLPRSVTRRPAPLTASSACRRDTEGSSTTRSHRDDRPSMHAPSASTIRTK